MLLDGIDRSSVFVFLNSIVVTLCYFSTCVSINRRAIWDSCRKGITTTPLHLGLLPFFRYIIVWKDPWDWNRIFFTVPPAVTGVLVLMPRNCTETCWFRRTHCALPATFVEGHLVDRWWYAFLLLRQGMNLDGIAVSEYSRRWQIMSSSPRVAIFWSIHSFWKYAKIRDMYCWVWLMRQQ